MSIQSNSKKKIVFLHCLNRKNMESKTLDQAKDVVDYIAFIINEFSLKNRLSMKQSFNYLYQYGGIEFLDEFYDIEHCENPNLTLKAIQDICARNGGTL